MINREDDSQTSIIERVTDYKPPRTLESWLIGRPLSTADAGHQSIGKAVGLAVFASDALSSTAYATQEILVILAAAGTLAFGYVFPISIAIVILLVIVSISYEQIIHAYPDGGGAYIVARDNLGEMAGLIAASSLLTDYILTVSVSVSSGVAQIVSAYPNIYNYRVHMAIVAVLFIMVINLRGVKEAGAAIAIPSFFFIIIMFLTVGVGLVRSLTGSLGVVPNPPAFEPSKLLISITPFLILDAFLPRQLTYRGSRLVYSRGIMTLALIACVLVVIFQASVTRLIPLYAIGVFMSFTLSQAGMALRWWKSGRLQASGKEIVERGSTLRFDRAWKFKMIAT